MTPRAPIIELGSTASSPPIAMDDFISLPIAVRFNDTRGAFTVQIKSERDLNVL